MSNQLYLPDRNDIIWIVLDPRVGHEQAGRRPALVLSPRFFSEHTNLAIICPITSRIRGLPFEIILEGTKTVGAILTIQVRAVDLAARHARFIEHAPAINADRTTKAVRSLIEPLL